jgi:hypothetical protein
MRKRNCFKQRHKLEGSSAISLPRARGKRLFGSLARVRGTGGRQLAPIASTSNASPQSVSQPSLSHFFVGTWGISKILANCGLSCIYSLYKFVFIILYTTKNIFQTIIFLI